MFKNLGIVRERIGCGHVSGPLARRVMAASLDGVGGSDAKHGHGSRPLTRSGFVRQPIDRFAITSLITLATSLPEESRD